MDKKALKRAVILNIAVLLTAVAMLVTVSFAWFTLSKISDTEQNITVGSFMIKLNDTDSDTFTGAQTVNLQNTFPMTEAYAEANSKALDDTKALENLYAYQVENAGTVKAMIRFKVAAGDANTPAIAPQIRFKLRTYTDASARGDWEARGLLAPPEGSAEVSLEAALNGIVTETVGTGEDGRVVASSRGLLASGEKRWFEILFWLDENATVDSTGSNAGAKTVTVRLTLDAMQSEGGASWEDFPSAGI